LQPLAQLRLGRTRIAPVIGIKASAQQNLAAVFLLDANRIDARFHFQRIQSVKPYIQILRNKRAYIPAGVHMRPHPVCVGPVNGAFMYGL